MKGKLFRMLFSVTCRPHYECSLPASEDLRKNMPGEKKNVLDSEIQIWVESAGRNLNCDSLCL